MIDKWKEELINLEKEMNERQVFLLSNDPLYRELNGRRMQLRKMILEVEDHEDL